WKSKNNTILPLKQGDNVVADIHFINDDDWTKVEADGEVYYYYNYKLEPNKKTSKLLDKVTFNPDTNLDDTCITTREGDVTTRVCNSGETGYDGATYTLICTVETVQYNKYTSVWNTDISIAPDGPAIVSDYLINNVTNGEEAVYNDETKDKMFVFHHGKTNQTDALTDYRYIGEDSKNYVYFNCSDLQNQNANTCEIWRIIGIFDVDDGDGHIEQRMKLVSNQFIINSSWDNRASEEYNVGYGKNEWEGSVIKNYLNGVYYDNLQPSAKNMIGNAKYFLGAISWKNDNAHYGMTENIYEEERGLSVYNNTRSTEWTGYVGLMYPSDAYMIYAKGVNSTCYNDPYFCRKIYISGEMTSEIPGAPEKGWIYNGNHALNETEKQSVWFLSPKKESGVYIQITYHDGSLYNRWGYENYGIRPSVYLNSNTKFIGGNGDINNPYKLKMIEN
ncbi:MAG: hypothetical protein IJR82_04890, partial [Bacilli bacterium]|nr:hypothetical protein [Bacilli bacterium]